MSNPWAKPSPAPEADELQPPEPQPLARPVQHTSVAAPSEAERLPQKMLTREELLQPLWLTGAHGGAGTTTFSTLLCAGDAGRAWPIAPWSDRRVRVLLCARLSYTGLRAAQTALREWASGGVPVELQGVVLTAAAPKLPRELRPLLDHVRAAASGAVWEVGWQGQWLLGEPQQTTDKQLERLIAELGNQRREP